MPPSDLEFLSVLGFLYLQNDKADKAVTVFRALQILQPGNNRVGRQLAYAWLIGGQHEECLSQVERCLATTNQPDARRSLQLIRSRALYGVGRESESRELMNSLLNETT